MTTVQPVVNAAINNPTQASFYTAARYILMLGGTWLATHGYIQNSEVNGLVSAVMIIGPIIWGIAQNYINTHTANKQKVVAMNATLNLVASGKAVDSSGSVIPYAVPGSTPPKPITETSAPEIVANFAPTKAV